MLDRSAGYLSPPPVCAVDRSNRLGRIYAHRRCKGWKRTASRGRVMARPQLRPLLPDGYDLRFNEVDPSGNPVAVVGSETPGLEALAVLSTNTSLFRLPPHDLSNLRHGLADGNLPDARCVVRSIAAGLRISLVAVARVDCSVCVHLPRWCDDIANRADHACAAD